MVKYTLEEVKENLNKLEKKLEDKNRDNGFWVIASRADFKPIKLQETIKGKEVTRVLVHINDIKKELLEGKEKYFKGKLIAYIHFFIAPYLFTNKQKFNENNLEQIKNDVVSAITINMYRVDDEGKIGTKRYNHWQCSVSFTVDDMMNHKLKFSDAEVLMRQVADQLVITVGLNSIRFKDYLKEVKKKLNKLNK